MQEIIQKSFCVIRKRLFLTEKSPFKGLLACPLGQHPSCPWCLSRYCVEMLHFLKDLSGHVVNFFLLFMYSGILCQELSLPSLGMDSNDVESSKQFYTDDLYVSIPLYHQISQSCLNQSQKASTPIIPLRCVLDGLCQCSVYKLIWMRRAQDPM